MKRAGTRQNPIYVEGATKRRRTTSTRSRAPSRTVAAEVKRVLNGRTGGFVGLEKKFFDSARGAFAIPSPSDATGGVADPTTLLCLNCPAQGDGEQNRDGRQISMNNITVRGLVRIAAQMNQTAADTISDVHIALVLDKQTNGAQLDSEDVFTNPSASAVLAAQPFRNLEYSQRFTVLKTIKIPAEKFANGTTMTYDGTNIEQQGTQVEFTMFHDLKGMKVNFISGQTSSVIAAIADNSLHVIAYTGNAGAAPTLYYNARLRFVG